MSFLPAYLPPSSHFFSLLRHRVPFTLPPHLSIVLRGAELNRPITARLMSL